MLKTKTMPQPVVNFNYADVSSISLKEKRQVKQFIKDLFMREGKSLRKLEYVFCSDEYLLQINRSYLNHDYYTDIITFDLSSSPDLTEGEVYISADRVRDNSATHGVSFANELLRVIFHGALHLCGYKDKKKSEITIMREKEEEYLRLFENKK